MPQADQHDRRVIDVELPEQPGPGSVVVDCEGYAWQRDLGPSPHVGQWSRGRNPNTFDECRERWVDLLVRTPLTVVWEPEQETPDAAG